MLALQSGSQRERKPFCYSGWNTVHKLLKPSLAKASWFFASGRQLETARAISRTSGVRASIANPLGASTIAFGKGSSPGVPRAFEQA